MEDKTIEPLTEEQIKNLREAQRRRDRENIELYGNVYGNPIDEYHRRWEMGYH